MFGGKPQAHPLGKPDEQLAIAHPATVTLEEDTPINWSARIYEDDEYGEIVEW